MAFNEKYLSEGETMVLRMREHPKVLFWPVMIFILLGVATGLGIAFMPTAWKPAGIWVLVAIVVVLFCAFVFWPWLKWYSSTIAITDRRIITRRGIINRKGHDLPLRRINNVNYDRDLLDRIFGCGTLTMETAAGKPLELHDIPDVERTQMVINNLLFDEAGPDGDSRGE